MTKQEIINTFDPSQPGLADATIFGLPFSSEQSEIIIIPVPWEVTVSYGAGASEGPDAILDACIAQDPHAKVAMETATKTGMVVLLGEVTMEGPAVDYEAIARRVCKEVGFVSEDIGLDADKMNVIINVASQSPEIAQSVHNKKFDETLGAGDQGLMFGYATNEWDQDTLHPLSHSLSNQIVARLKEARLSGEIAWLRPDCKSQVTLEYD